METNKNTRKGIFFILTSVVLFGFMDMLVQMAGELPVLQKMFFRNLISFFVALLLILQSKEPIRIQKRNVPLHFLRSLGGTLGMIGKFYAIDHMLLSDATVLQKLSPFFTVIFCYLLLKERTTWVQWLCIATAFAGSLFVAKPTGAGFGNPAALAAIASAMSGGFAYAMVRWLSLRGERGPVIVLIFSAFSCLSALPTMLFNYTPMTGQQLFYLILVGLFAAGAQFSLTAAYRHAPASELSVFDYTAPIFAAILGFVFFRQVSDPVSYIGYAIIIFAGVAMFFYSTRRMKKLSEKAVKTED